MTAPLAKMTKGAVAMICMDWRHIEELIVAGKALLLGAALTETAA